MVKEIKSVTCLWKFLKVLIFLSFVYTAIVMIKLHNISTAINIIFTISFFLIFNKIENMDRKIKILEEK